MLWSQLFKLLTIFISQTIVTSTNSSDDFENSTTTRLIMAKTTPKESILLTQMTKKENFAKVQPPQVSVKKTAKFVNKGSSIKRHRESVDVSSIPIGDATTEWRCPNITGSRSLECGCDLPHTLRCNGDVHGLTVSFSDQFRIKKCTNLNYFFSRPWRSIYE